MTLVVQDLVCISNQAGARLFLYRTADTIGTVTGASYFDNSASRLAVGDIIICSSSYGGTEAVDVLVVDSISAANVVVVVNGT